MECGEFRKADGIPVFHRGLRDLDGREVREDRADREGPVGQGGLAIFEFERVEII